MRILVAGGTGVVGLRAVEQLVVAGHDVKAVSRRAVSDELLLAAGASPIRLDVFDPHGVAVGVDGVDAVVNLATSIPPVPRSLLRRSWAANDRLRREASRGLADAALAAGARFVQESFAPAYPDRGKQWIDEDQPLEPEFASRTVLDAEASARRVSAGGGIGVVLRFGLFYGGRATDWIERASKGWLMLPGAADAYASMVLVDDAAASVVAALELPAGVYNVVDDEPMTRQQVAAALAAALGTDRLRLLPSWIERVPMLRPLARSQRTSNRRLREASSWRPQAPSVREGWPLAIRQASSG